jgi:poly(hydroxyalkanoate) granule-associated protein
MMVKKKAKVIQNDLMDSAHKIWLAGLGAFAMAEEEGGKIFKGLIEKGEGVETQGKQEVEKAKTTALGTVAGMKTVAESYWDTMERTMDDQLTTVIHRMGIPTKGEIEELTTKVEQLTVSVDKLRANQAAGAKTAARKPAAKKTTTAKKATTAKKTAAASKTATTTKS